MSNNNSADDIIENFSAIDKAIQAAKARKLAKAGASEPAPANAPIEQKATKPPKPPKELKRPRLTGEEKAARTAAKEAERATKKAEREATRAAKKAARAAEKHAPHMSKVERAAGKLPVLNETAQVSFNDIIANFSASQVAAIAAHLNHFNRVKATERALNQKVTVGDTVRILSGDPRFIGQTGTVARAQRIRCYVEVEGAKKPVYLFTSDVELVSAAADQNDGGQVAMTG
jgi:flagellar biosynthesis GTPase FlhF